MGTPYSGGAGKRPEASNAKVNRNRSDLWKLHRKIASGVPLKWGGFGDSITATGNDTATPPPNASETP